MSEHEQTSPSQDENQIMAERRQKLKSIREQRIAFPNDFKRSHFAQVLQDTHAGKEKEALEAEKIEVAVAGRMMLKRVMGKASFATLQDGSGRIQAYISNDGVGEELHAEFKHWDLGDIVAVKGTLFKTKTGELTVQASEVRLLSKNIRPLPEKFHGITDQETKYRQRYADLIMNEDSRQTFIKRSKIIQKVRDVMVGEGYLEVETPMMHPIPGGAAAKPFVTHHNALDMPLYLRIAPELYLKRLVVGGLERVFEINRNFRNEGMSTRHNPEFTMIEFYEAYSDYQRMMEMTETIIRECALVSCGSTTVSYQGKEVDLGKPFDRFTIVGAIKHYNPQYTDAQLADAAWVASEIKRLGGKLPPAPGLGSLQLALFEECAESLLWNPTFIIDYPVEVSPLARGSDSKPGLTERFELFIVGREHANGYSELNDPEDQAARFLSQVAQKDAGDDEAMHYDADYIRAMEYGLPPTGGCGIGIDRLVMLLTDAPSIRDVILFPQMRPE
ncbi:MULTISPECIES: lysine--tRNA ligase [Chromobacterium]|uniref:Lysine--tRNA ligase n=2 Tax=Chromobacterium TaxID=535 RepID=A0ABS3GPJ2_9NEIS|nr:MULTISPECIES: lysine--tRNA ligase [Chromobacterium]AXT45359.1 lysine--tRNA ligase [Chromobacterium rhizoryzae]MBK0416902.1 lysine--tRNA ligase [Chromobacterium haemolyticum]MBO0416973.1 lysine--tRNA ligase [Chromobacterium haemolyticum]MBO0501290.1 lysine--tRNA ligase [Chromobacterium haemolyticum]OQS37832.1 lysine--tRNA ligase [Chromobacterium haemolyticum]